MCKTKKHSHTAGTSVARNPSREINRVCHNYTSGALSLELGTKLLLPQEKGNVYEVCHVPFESLKSRGHITKLAPALKVILFTFPPSSFHKHRPHQRCVSLLTKRQLCSSHLSIKNLANEKFGVIFTLRLVLRGESDRDICP